MKSIIKTHASICYRLFLCVAFLVVLFLTKLETAKIAPVAMLFVLGICAGMVCCRRSRYLTLPFFLLTLMLIFCFDSYDVFIHYVWLAPVIVVALIIHLIRLKPKFKRGVTFLPLCAVAIATMLGGVGAVSVAEYFNPMALYYVAGLGPVLVLFYLILQNELDGEADCAELLTDFAAFGLTATAVVFLYFLIHLQEITESGQWPVIQWSNNISTMLMLTMPAVFALAKRNLAWIPAGVAALAAAMLSGSRGGILLSPAVAAVCLFWLWRGEDRANFARRIWLRFFFWLLCFCMVGMMALVVTGWIDFNLSDTSESRWRLLWRSLDDFRTSPVFGKGFCYQGNSDIYNAKKGAMNWYHMFFPQIWGGLGLCGVLAWGWQLRNRAVLAFLRRGNIYFAFGLCYFGLLLMSLVNPGEFCPIPYAFSAVLCFVALEKTGGTKTGDE